MEHTTTKKEEPKKKPTGQRGLSKKARYARGPHTIAANKARRSRRREKRAIQVANDIRSGKMNLHELSLMKKRTSRHSLLRRIVQEAINRLHKHSNAPKIKPTLHQLHAT